MSDTTLRLRRAFTAPGDDDPADSSRPIEILDHSEQKQVVNELVEQARRSARQYRAAGALLTAIVVSLLALIRLPSEAVSAFLSRLAFLSLLVSLFRQIYVLRTSTSLTLPLDALPALPPLLVAILAYRADSLADEKRLLWTLAPVGAQIVALLLDWEARRVVFEDADEATELAAGHLPPATVDFVTPREREGAFVDDEDDLQGGLYAVMDQDWADAAGDFTKRYNRMKQQVLVSHGAAAQDKAGSSTSSASARAGGVLPAVNRPRRAPQAATSTSTTAKAGEKEAVHLNKVTDQLAHYSRFASRIQLDPLYMTSGTATRKGGSEKILVKDKSDRATNEQVLDPRTRLILFKMLGRGLIERIDGCVSTGKEANVYHAVSPEGKHIALKIYKTSILVFKDRDRYVSGEFRFKSGYARNNPRKMVRLWAEKELRNLRRMKGAGLRVPEAIEVRENVLVMDFIGEDEWQASPRLKDAQIPPEQQRSLYIEILVLLRAIFHRCRLVHADFSEYNILYHQGHLWVIDVSQSIEHEHPSAFDFLRADIQNAEDFFAKQGVDTLGLTRTFNFVTRDSWVSGREETDEDAAEEIERLLAQAEAEANEPAQANGAGASGQQQEAAKPSESDEAVFAKSYIPRTLEDVYDAERDVQRVLRGEGKDLIYADITGVASIHGKANKGEGGEGGLAGVEEEEEDGDSDDDSESGEEDSEEKGEDGEKQQRPKGKKFEDKDEKKKRRQEVKEQNREKRATKMKKKDKARKVKKTSGKR
ncbi:Atypical/RIO/RIO1 protein kinase [Rhodotorula toruloides ATCC 204091]|nr:Atypical/RIO/RIO1 protein kinase [Rhodotorula toruloides ATCC 204091]